MANMNFGVNILPKATNTYSLGNSDYKWLVNGYAISEASEKEVDTSITSSSSVNLPTTSAVVAYILSKFANPVFTGTLSMGRLSGSTVGSGSVALGADVTASGTSSFAVGNQTIANHYAQMVLGEFNVADASTAQATARGNYILIVGNGTASNSRSDAMTLDWNGNLRVKGALYVGANADGSGGTAVLTATDISGKADKSDTVLLTTLSRGRKADTTVGSGSFAFGLDVTASATRSFGFGSYATASAVNAIAVGSNVTASGTYSFAQGYYSTASEMYAVAINWYTRASGRSSFAQGDYTIANHLGQSAFGAYNVADPSSETALNRGNYIIIVGNGTANNARSDALTLDWSGNLRIGGTLYVGASSDGTGGTAVLTSHQDISGKADKVSSATNGNFAGLDSNGNLTDSGSKASDFLTSHQDISGKADKNNTVLDSTLSRGRLANTTVGTGSVAFGREVTASGSYSVAFGDNNVSSGSASTCFGASNTSSGNQTFAIGSCNTASGAYSFAQGIYTVANHKCQSVFGAYNVEDPSTALASAYGNYIIIVGNGTAYNAHSNAMTLDWSGNMQLAGDLTLNAFGASPLSLASRVVPFTGATSNSAGTIGLVPAPQTNQTARYLKSDGSWNFVHGLDHRTSLTKGTKPSDTTYYLYSVAYDSGGLNDANRLAYSVGYITPSGNSWNQITAVGFASNSTVTNSIGVGVNYDGTLSYVVSSPSAFRTAIDAVGKGCTWQDLKG